MRMRKKKHLEERLDNCNEFLLKIDIESLNFKSKDKHKGHFNCEEIFSNNNPVHLEIGCGKGQFIIQCAKLHPEINFIAVEKTKNVIVTAIENAKKENITNLKFINIGAEYLSQYFDKDSVERLYLNFSCPYPKKKYSKHRLTHQNFLCIYKDILKTDAEIHMKTDNAKLFEFTLNSMSDFGYSFKNITFDLHNSDFKDNIITEYEERFVQMGMPIYRLEAYCKIVN